MILFLCVGDPQECKAIHPDKARMWQALLILFPFLGDYF